MFWVRRVVALTLVGGLVWALVGLVGMLDLSADGETETPQATTAASSPTTAPSVDADAVEDAAARAERRAAARALRLAEREEEDELAVPTGPCADGDVVVTPQVSGARAGTDVTVDLELTTVEAAACTFELDPEDVFVTIKDDTSTLWSSQHCPGSLPTATTVPRRSTPDTVSFTWNGKESMTGCAVDTSWVFPGTYQVTAVARGSVTPVETLFTLGRLREEDVAAAPGSEDDSRTDSEDGAEDESSDSDDSSARADGTQDDEQAEPETEEQAAERRDARREALREARRQHREDQRAERDAG